MNILLAWIESNAALLGRMSVSIVLHPDQGEAESKSHYADFDHEKALGRITIWPSLGADLEFISAEDGKQMYWKNVEKVDAECIDEWFREMSLFLNSESSKN